ncbi:transmembrane protease serine 9-like [Tetranychus urticae]|uniref:Peptidase S1 domain-containing protein n=1 Tax=Tetranychus urticae TaxID=32264 RepID=T1K719_TETUR|nr:transmembrane protease serine 9-like [Tetranychus urticae]
MSLTLFASILALLINQSFACDCGQAIDYIVMDRSKGLLTRFPWYVVIENKSQKPCGASLIDDQHVAVAAHCLSGSNEASLRARLNDNSTKSISSVWIDERYNNKTGAYDFAVLTLASPVGSQFKPICLRDSTRVPTPPIHLVSPKADKNVEGFPYNYLYNHPGSKCPSPATQTHLCIMNPTKVDNTCSEGPYMGYESNARFYLTGVTSRCFSTEMPDLFTDVSLYKKQIRELAPKGCWKDTWDWSR